MAATAPWVSVVPPCVFLHLRSPLQWAHDLMQSSQLTVAPGPGLGSVSPKGQLHHHAEPEPLPPNPIRPAENPNPLGKELVTLL